MRLLSENRTWRSKRPPANVLDNRDCSAHWLDRCGIKASVENLAQRNSIDSIVCSDGDDPGPWFSAIPFIPDCDIHSLADDLKDDPPAGFFGGMNHAFASVDAGRELARRFPQRFQGKRLFVS